MKNKWLLILLAIFMIIALVGTANSAWIFTDELIVYNSPQATTLNWDFDDTDFAVIGNISNCSYLTPLQETSIVSPRRNSVESVRLINTAGTQTKDHTFVVSTDRDYTVDEIKVMKVEFDYYHAKKRQQIGKGFPKVQLAYNGSGKGNTQGGGETVNSKSAFIATNINEDWWHLEYYITALCPTNDIVAHSDSPISKTQKINGIKITDSAIYNYNDTTAFIVIDNVKFSSVQVDRLGLFNRGTSFALTTGYYWMKICWVGELQSCVMTFSDPTIAEQDSHPFYIHALKKGTVEVTAILTMINGQVLSISNTITIT